MKWFDWIMRKKTKQVNTLVNRFDFHLLKCCYILRTSNSGYTHEDEYDLYAITYVISDFAFSVANKNRKKSSDKILNLLIGKLAVRYPGIPISCFRSRVDFYSMVINGMPLHAHCLPGVDLSNANPVSCCAIAFCDCLMNPQYVSNYRDHRQPVVSAFDALKVATEIWEPLNSELAALYNDMYTLAK